MSGVRERRQRVRELSLFSSFPFSLPPSLGLRGLVAPLPCPGLVARGAAGSRGAGTRETPPLPTGKIAPQVFCFPKPFRAAEPGVRTPVCGPGCRVQRGNRVWGTAPALGGGGGARGNCKFVRSRASALSSRPKLPHSSRGWSRVPVWAVRASPVTPGAKAAGEPGAANRAVGPGRGGGWGGRWQSYGGARFAPKNGQGIGREGVILEASPTLGPERQDAQGPVSRERPQGHGCPRLGLIGRVLSGPAG